MLLVNVHELDLIFTDPVRCVVLERQRDDIGRVLSLQRKNVLALSRAQHLCKRAQVDAECDVAVAAKRRECFGPQQHRDESDVGVVHGLEGDARVIAVEVAVLYEVFDGVDNLVSRQLCTGRW